jgi:uncharacterized glyoxalase superfamily protein PhnB
MIPICSATPRGFSFGILSSHWHNVGIHIFTEDLETLYTELENRGALVSQGILCKPWGNRDFRVNDDSGNEIKFTEPLSSDE